MIEFLIHEAGFSPGRITTELPIPSRRSSGSIRADILCFDELLRPLLLIECKSERVKLNEGAAMQAARYNMSVKAPYLMLSNGLQDYLFAVQEDGGTRNAGEFGSVFPLQHEAVRPLTYWQERGLWGWLTDPNEALITDFLHRFWREAVFGEGVHYLEVRLPELPRIPGFFARVYRTELMHHAVGILSDGGQSTWLVHGRAQVSENPGSVPTFRLHAITPHRVGILSGYSGIDELIGDIDQWV